MKAAIPLILSAALIAACQTTGGFQPAPLPSNVAIEQPAADIAPEFATYSGTWRGKWGGSLDTYLVVEDVDPPTADVIYAWGTNRNVERPGWMRRTGRFNDNELVVLLGPGVTTTFEMESDGTISAEYINEERGWHSTAVLTKVD